MNTSPHCHSICINTFIPIEICLNVSALTNRIVAIITAIRTICLTWTILMNSFNWENLHRKLLGHNLDRYNGNQSSFLKIDLLAKIKTTSYNASQIWWHPFWPEIHWNSTQRLIAWALCGCFRAMRGHFQKICCQNECHHILDALYSHEVFFNFWYLLSLERTRTNKNKSMENEKALCPRSLKLINSKTNLQCRQLLRSYIHLCKENRFRIPQSIQIEWFDIVRYTHQTSQAHLVSKSYLQVKPYLQWKFRLKFC